MGICFTDTGSTIEHSKVRFPGGNILYTLCYASRSTIDECRGESDRAEDGLPSGEDQTIEKES